MYYIDSELLNGAVRAPLRDRPCGLFIAYRCEVGNIKSKGATWACERARKRDNTQPSQWNGRNYYEISTYTFALDACDLVTLAYAIMAFIIYISLNNQHDLKWSEKEATLQIPQTHKHTDNAFVIITITSYIIITICRFYYFFFLAAAPLCALAFAIFPTN